MKNLREHITNINILLERVYKKPILISDVLKAIGVSDDDLSELRKNHMREISDIVVHSIQSCFNTNLKGGTRRHFAILSRRLGLEGESETLASIAKDYGLTRERIRQIQKQALGKCRGNAAKIQKEIERQLSLQVQSILKK